MIQWAEIRQRHQVQARLFRDNAEEVLDTNSRSLKQMIRISLIVFSFLLVVSFTDDGFASLKSAYGLLWVSSALLLLFFWGGRHKRVSLPGMYCMSALFLWFTVYLSIVNAPEQTGASIIGLLALMPLVILDVSWRVNLITLACFAVHSYLACVVKVPDIAVDDVVNGICFSLIGILLGSNVRAIKLENFEMKRQAQLQRDTDFLTGLYNRRKMFEELEKQKSGCDERISGILMLDIDQFKVYNDQMGHINGDDCLRRLGALLKQAGQRLGLTFFRYGGEEFLAFYYASSDHTIGDAAETIRRMVLELNIPFPGSAGGQVTASIGYSQAAPDAPIVGDWLILQADQALYRAKALGRNRTEPFSV